MIWLLVWGLFIAAAFWVYSDAEGRKGMSAPLMGLLTFCFPLVGLILYLAIRENHPRTSVPDNLDSSYHLNYRRKKGVTPSQQRMYDNEKRKAQKKQFETKQLYHNKGKEDAKIHSKLDLEAFDSLIEVINTSDVKLFEILPELHMNLFDNPDYVAGYLETLMRIRKETQAITLIGKRKRTTI